MFKNTSVGLDIADHTIEVVELRRGIRGIKTIGLGRVILEPGIVSRGRIADVERLEEKIKEAFRRAQPNSITTKEIVFGLPGGLVFTHAFRIESKNKKEWPELIGKEIGLTIPLEKKNLISSYSVLQKDEEGAEILTVSTSSVIAKEWRDFFKKINFKVEFFDFGALAVLRDLFKEDLSAPVCVVDIGSVTTNIIILNKIGLRYSHTIAVAGNDFTAIIANKTGDSFETAEGRKKELGLVYGHTEVDTALLETADLILEEVSLIIKYYEDLYGEKISKIVLVGGSSQLKGLLEYAREKLGIEILIGQAASLKGAAPLEYLGAIGLALKTLEKKWMKKDPVIYMKALKHKRTKTQKNENTKERKHEDVKNNNKIRSQVILLISILIIGAIFIGLAFLYRGVEKNKNNKELEKIMNINGRL